MLLGDVLSATLSGCSCRGRPTGERLNTVPQYIVVGVRFEEADLRRALGAPYAEYARSTPAILPVRRRA